MRTISSKGDDEQGRVLEACSGEMLEIRDDLGRTRACFDPVEDSAILYVPGTEITFRLTNGKLEISCPAGLRFSTPGEIQFAAGTGLRMESGSTSVDLAPGRIKIASDDVGISAQCLSVTGGVMKARLERLTLTVGKLEQFAGRVIQQARCVFQGIETLLHTRAGRIRTEAVESHLIQAESVRVVADEEVRIQADAISLG